MKKFIFLFISSACVALLMLGGFNAFVDPYDIFLSRLIQRKDKPHIDTKIFLTKFHDIKRLKPKNIILGSSRVMIGLDPDHLKEITHEEWYNGGIHLARFDDIFYYFELALKEQPDLKRVIIGIDLFAFNSTTTKMWEKYFGNQFSLFPWLHYCPVLFTQDALKASIKTLLHLFRPNPSYTMIHPNGSATYACVPLSVCMSRLVDRFAANAPLNYYGNFQLSQEALTKFERMVSICKERNIRLDVFISPTHAQYWKEVYKKGLWENLENLKRALVAHIPLWDFTDCALIQQQEFYLDFDHFCPALGKRFMASIFQELEYGCLLDRNNVEEKLEVFRSLRSD